jgi:hypothetical protein
MSVIPAPWLMEIRRIMLQGLLEQKVRPSSHPTSPARSVEHGGFFSVHTSFRRKLTVVLTNV